MRRILLASTLLLLTLVTNVCAADTAEKMKFFEESLGKDDWQEYLYKIELTDCSEELGRALLRKAESSSNLEELCRYLAASEFVSYGWKMQLGLYPDWNRDLFSDSA